MNQKLGALLAAGTLLGFGGACAQANKSPSGPTGPSGQLHISTHAQVSTAANQNTDPDSICATFTLTPYAPSSDGSSAVQAGSPVTFTTSNTSTATDQILGCIAGSTDYDFPNPLDGGTTPDNWGYLVSATGFVYCDPAVQAATPLDTSTVDPAPAYYVPVDCVAGQDEGVTIDYPISLSSADPGGYIDISAGVTSTNQYVGCKEAEQDSSGTLYFGQSNTIDTLNAVPLGLLSFQTSAIASDAFLQQFGGQTWAADPSNPSATMYDTYYTGQFATGSSGAPTLPSAIFQTFLTDATEANLFDGGSTGCTEWVDSEHAMCVTTPGDGMHLSGTPPPWNTQGALADAFIYSPGGGFAAASVTSPGTITIYSQALINNSADDYTSPSGPVVSEYASPGFASNAGSISPQAGFNDGLSTPTINPPSSIYTFTGVYISLTTAGAFIVTMTDGTANYWVGLKDTAGTWALGATVNDFSVKTPPAGTGQQSVGCLNFDSDTACNSSEATGETKEIQAFMAQICPGTVAVSLTGDLCSTNPDTEAEIGRTYEDYVTAYHLACGGCSGVSQPSDCTLQGIDLICPGCVWSTATDSLDCSAVTCN